MPVTPEETFAIFFGFLVRPINLYLLLNNSICLRAVKVALALVDLLFDPSILVTMLVIPAASTMVLTAPPAIRPVPLGAGFKRILAALNLALVSKGMVPFTTGMVTWSLLANLMAFLMASATLGALV